MVHELVALVVVVANGVVLSLGAIITHLAYRAYRRTRRREIGRFALGFALVTLGSLLGGGLHQLVGTHILVAVLAQASISALGFAVLAHSLYLRVPDEGRQGADSSGGHSAD